MHALYPGLTVCTVTKQLAAPASPKMVHPFVAVTKWQMQVLQVLTVPNDALLNSSVIVGSGAFSHN
jgi:hypothetical protein